MAAKPKATPAKKKKPNPFAAKGATKKADAKKAENELMDVPADKPKAKGKMPMKAAKQPSSRRPRNKGRG